MQIPERTVSAWLGHCKHHGKYFAPGKRDRPSILTEAEENTVFESLEKVRVAPHCRSVLAGKTAAIARGARSRPGLLVKQGGACKMGREYARYLLRRRNWAKRAKTSDRTVPDEEIVAAAGPFFKSVRAIASSVPPELFFNMDEFAMLLDGQNRWTWAPGGVSIRDAKEAFTAGVVSNAAGASWPAVDFQGQTLYRARRNRRECATSQDISGPSRAKLLSECGRFRTDHLLANCTLCARPSAA